jgi:hypothetical protein
MKNVRIITIMHSTNIQIASLAVVQSISNSVNKISALLQYDFRYKCALCNRNVV